MIHSSEKIELLKLALISAGFARPLDSNYTEAWAIRILNQLEEFDRPNYTIDEVFAMLEDFTPDGLGVHVSDEERAALPPMISAVAGYEIVDGHMKSWVANRINLSSFTDRCFGPTYVLVKTDAEKTELEQRADAISRAPWAYGSSDIVELISDLLESLKGVQS